MSFREVFHKEFPQRISRVIFRKGFRFFVRILFPQSGVEAMLGFRINKQE
jgi:hypothetical protein